MQYAICNMQYTICNYAMCNNVICTNAPMRSPMCVRKNAKSIPALFQKCTPAGGRMVSLHQCKKCQGVLFQLFRHNLDALELPTWKSFDATNSDLHGAIQGLGNAVLL